MERVTVHTAPTGALLTAQELRDQVSSADAADDSLLSAAMGAAVDECEQIMGRAILAQKWRYVADAFPGGTATLAIQAPGTAIDSVKYVDLTGVEQTLPEADYVADVRDDYVLRITPAVGKVWPATLARSGAVEVVFSCGWANPGAVPENVKQWVKLRAGGYYTHREAITERTPLYRNEFVDRLLDRWVVPRW